MFFINNLIALAMITTLTLFFMLVESILQGDNIFIRVIKVLFFLIGVFLGVVFFILLITLPFTAVYELLV